VKTATYQKHVLHFKQPSGTSRGVLKSKETWFIIIEQKGKKGIGECGMFKGLSVDDRPDFEKKLAWTCKHINDDTGILLQALTDFPSIQFGLETAFKSLEAENPFELFPSEFTKGTDSIPINGLIWMGTEDFMREQIKEKITSGFKCIKMKIGAINFQSEVEILKSIRKEFSSNNIELRVDANGAFSASEALEKLQILSELDIHSIEQPIKQGQIIEMARLCKETPLPIALDEELIGVFSKGKKDELLKAIKPQFIILKPTLVGGFKGTNEWIELAESNNIGWWITSALESNVGLNAITQYTYTKNNRLPQGLGTGSLFTNNFESPLEVNKGAIHYNNKYQWNFNL